ncbi:hypothetical protein [Desulfogranum marinum]|uniref:hypothetical protein n=1 Tax=Desulfogranum marinum TaxID=453220 RepID=UPI00196305FA|nr:hypothetical protein [Desulfogranum marinum]MBM9515243.1 hypothetical protein [Desulfogranum marinum]
MNDIFDDGVSWEELAIALGLSEEIAEEERKRFQLHQDNEPIVPEGDDPEWWEKD